MKKTALILIPTLITGCSLFKPKKEYEYVLDSGQVATAQQVAAVKTKCEYDKKMKEAQDNFGIAISVGRYESGYGPKTSDKYTKEAARLMGEATSCVKENGLTRREKVKV